MNGSNRRVTAWDAPLHRRVAITRRSDLLPSPAFSHSPHSRGGADSIDESAPTIVRMF